MDYKTANKLNEFTNAFYAQYTESFSSTRQAPWNGWKRCLEYIKDTFNDTNSIRVLDIACGNMRFKEFLSDSLNKELNYFCIDSCPAFVSGKNIDHFQKLDIVDSLLSQHNFTLMLEAPDCDVVCSFGFMHHIPGKELRAKFLETMLSKTRPGGLTFVTFWQFEKEPRLAEKANTITRQVLESYPELVLEDGDRLLGWQDKTDALRYCHSFSDFEIQTMIENVSSDSELLACFDSDGKCDNLNRYLVFRRH